MVCCGQVKVVKPRREKHVHDEVNIVLTRHSHCCLPQLSCDPTDVSSYFPATAQSVIHLYIYVLLRCFTWYLTCGFKMRDK